jgi:hypothetical protein
MASTTPARTRQTAAARKRAAAKPKPAVDEEEFELVELSSEVPEEERVPLFKIDDRVYTVPKFVPQGISLEFVRLNRQQGESVAAVRLLERMLGPEAYEALEQCPTLDNVKMQKIIDMAQKLAFGKAEIKEGKAP